MRRFTAALVFKSKSGGKAPHSKLVDFGSWRLGLVTLVHVG
ncbi:hypothetical protein FRUB_06356 [Fimbriiglobus ruber]|uniref:Uncharacterized protein n=1 Tax=Fimbriiglobus ruber TaxID=1908690 RepID=A0A225DBD9_9BACT|nr:hypothetical protein FRUB_06356 [Fimbriiglobus ruber]